MSWWTRASRARLVAAQQRLLAPTQTYESHQVRLPDGNLINSVSLRGEVREPLVMVHGYGAGLAFWFKNLNDLARVSSPYALDLLGFGLSSRPKPSFRKNDVAGSEAFFVDSLAAWADAMKLDRFVLMGHSFGGYVSVAFAERFPQRVRQLILVSPFGLPARPHDANSVESGRAGFVADLWERGVTPMDIVRVAGPLGNRLVQALVERRFYWLPAAERAALSEYVHQIWAADGSGEYALAALYEAFGWARSPLEGRLRAAGLPVSFVYGEYDWMDWRVADRVQRSSGNPNLRRVIVVPDCGHQVFLENPSTFNAVVRDVLRAAP